MALKSEDKLKKIKTLAGEFDSTQDAIAYIEDQKRGVARLVAENAALTKEVEELRNKLIVQSSRLISSTIASEEMICNMQIRRLEEVSLQRQLSLEETKRLQIYVNCLDVIRKGNENTFPTEGETLPSDTAELIKLAAQPDLAIEEE